MGRSSRWSDLTPGVLPGDRTRPAIEDTPQQGTVIAVTSAGARVEVTGIRTQVCGPMPWSLGAYDTPALAISGGFAPRVGDRCLVVFAGAGIGDPWLVAWWR